MPKFTKYEKAIIKCALSHQIVVEKTNLRKMEKNGKIPLFTDDFLDDVYDTIKAKVEELTYKR